jgi:DNA primase
VFTPSKSEDKTESKIVVSLPREFLPLWTMNKSLYRNQAKSFLHKRGITDVDIKKYKIGFCDSGLYEGRIIIPSYDDKGLLNYFVGRSFVGEKMKYKNPNVSRDIIPFDWYIAWSKPIVLCEGVFDAMSIRSNAIPMLSKKPSKSLLQKIFEKNVKTIYIALDDDAKKDAYNMSEFFRDFGIDCKVVKLPTDKDPNDLGWEKITTLIHTTESASFSDSIQARLYG